MQLAAQRCLRRRVLVTAAGSGIGKAIAARLQAEGAHVCGVDIDGAAIAATAEELPGLLPFTGCVSDEETVKGIAGEVEAALGGLDGLVNSELTPPVPLPLWPACCRGRASHVSYTSAACFSASDAGISGEAGDVTELCLDKWKQLFDINVNGYFLFCKHFAPLMQLPKPDLGDSAPALLRGGSIVNISSNGGGKFVSFVGSEAPRQLGLRPPSGHSSAVRALLWCCSARRQCQLILSLPTWQGYPYRLPYATGKAALNGMTQTLAMDLAKHGIRVNSVLPGLMSGDRSERVMRMTADVQGVPIESGCPVSAEPYARPPVRPTAHSCTAVFVCSGNRPRLTCDWFALPTASFSRRRAQ